MIQYSWDQFDQVCNELASCIQRDNLKIDAIIGIPRGGLIIAVKMSHLLNIPMEDPNVFNIHKNILICDDIADTGKTLAKYLVMYTNAQFLTLHKHNHSTFTPNYYFEEVNDWVVYPWETMKTSKADYRPEYKSEEEYIAGQ